MPSSTPLIPGIKFNLAELSYQPNLPAKYVLRDMTSFLGGKKQEDCRGFGNATDAKTNIKRNKKKKFLFLYFNLNIPYCYYIHFNIFCFHFQF